MKNQKLIETLAKVVDRSSGQLMIPDFRLNDLSEEDRDAVLAASTGIGTIDRGDVAYYVVDDDVAEDYKRWMDTPDSDY